MALKIRLRQQGRRNFLQYRLVVTDSLSPRDGKYLEVVGWYNPKAVEEEKKFSMEAERIEHWLNEGAILTETVGSLLKKAAPELMKRQAEKKDAHRVKQLAKQKARRKKAAA